MTGSRIVVVGAGVAGLTTAWTLAKNSKSWTSSDGSLPKDPKYIITVAAKHMPGDYDIEYASPWAGANYLPVSKKGTPEAEREMNTWPELERLARHHPEAGVHFTNAVLYNRQKDLDTTMGARRSELLEREPWFKDTVPNFKQLSPSELPKDIDYGVAFTSVCINTAIYLNWLTSQCLKAGVVFQRGIFKHIADAAYAHHSGKKADVVINCTGLAAGKLGGVEDKDMIAARGQTVLVRNDPGAMISTSGVDHAYDEAVYIMQRAAGGGTILGGCYQVGNWDSSVDLNLATRIMQRAVDICPALTGGKGIDHLSVIRHSVGLRPLRTSGVRLEKEKIGGVWVVHNYGHGGFGYQSSYGCSQVAAKLTEEALSVAASKTRSSL